MSYLTTAGLVQPLTPPTLSQIGPPGGDNFNLNNDGGLGGFNGLGDGLNNLGGDLGNLGKGLGDGLNNLGGGLGNLGNGSW